MSKPSEAAASSASYTGPNQQDLNKALENAKSAWWSAKFAGDQAGMDAAAQQGEQLREMGAIETIEAKQLDRQNNAKLEAQKNEKLSQAKSDWWDAFERGDQAGMDKAAQQGEQLRAQGAVETEAAKKIDQDHKNQLLLDAKRSWWEARLAGDKKAMAEAEERGEILRKGGATDTVETARLDTEYAKKLKALQDQLTQAKQKKLNDDLTSVKEQWWKARLADNAELMDKFSAEGERLRAAGAMETDRSREVDAKYGLLLKDKLQNEKLLYEAKKRWWEATLNLDQNGVLKAQNEANKLRGKAYVNDQTEALQTLDRENRQFLQAKQQYYTDLLNLRDTSASKDAMKRATAKGASLSVTRTYEMDQANLHLISLRKQYWREQAADDSKGASEIERQEHAYRKSLGAFSSLMVEEISSRSYELDKVANEAIYQTQVKWEAYAKLSKKELSQPSNGMAWINGKLKNSYKQLNGSGLGEIFKRTKLDDVNEQLVQLRNAYWSAEDQYNSAVAKAREEEWSKLVAANKTMEGLLKSSQTDADNDLFLRYREKMNQAIKAGDSDTAIHYIRTMQQLSEESGSDVTIRRSNAVAQNDVNQLMVYIKEKEWDNLLALRSDEGGRLAKAKTAVRNNLLADLNSAEIRELDRVNLTILSAKRDYWQAAANLSTTQIEQAEKALQSAAANKYSTLGASLDTAFDRLYRDGIELNLLEWTGKGHSAQEQELAGKREAWKSRLNQADSLTRAHMTSLNISFEIPRLADGTKLNQTLEQLYIAKAGQWHNKARGLADTAAYAEAEEKARASIGSVLHQVNSKIPSDLKLPTFAMDAANRKVLEDRDGILEAIQSGNRAKAQAYWGYGMSRQSEGATLKIYELVPDLNQVQWLNRSEAENLNMAMEFAIQQANDNFTSKEISALQKALKDMKIYEGAVSGQYNKETYVAVYAYQELLKSDARAAIWEKQDSYLGRNGYMTKDLINFAVSDVGLGRENAVKTRIEETRKAVKYFGVGDGIVTQLANDGMELLHTTGMLSPLSGTFWKETLPELKNLTKGIWTGEITIKDLFGSLKDQVRKEFVEPFEYIKKNYKKVWEGNVSYEESQEFGKNLAKAIQVVAAAVTLGVGAAVKIASKLPKLMKGVEDALLNAPVKRGELQDRVVGGKGNFAGQINSTNIPNMTKKEILDSLPADWKYTENNGFVHVKDANGNIRMRIDPPDKVTKYDHVHLYDENGNSLDINLNIVDRKSPDAHIPIKK
ncbi:hypothetical protein [Paenibacillus sp. NEAU-GSW1]|uniref:hypothetical protein n=1 Tax=Paenibacillus sp. NEAU-GSW1 TaxID=2682486 RepID=UPI0020A6C8F1|nr:hypothetical protein [Paenibacillus sp. NEAU-GSW1]